MNKLLNKWANFTTKTGSINAQDKPAPAQQGKLISITIPTHQPKPKILSSKVKISHRCQISAVIATSESNSNSESSEYEDIDGNTERHGNTKKRTKWLSQSAASSHCSQSGNSHLVNQSKNNFKRPHPEERSTPSNYHSTKTSQPLSSRPDNPRRSTASPASSNTVDEPSEDSETESSISVCPIGGVIKDRWLIICKLGSGGFGAVYEIEDIQDPARKRYALKIESPKHTKDKLMRLELNVLKRLQGTKHACTLMGCGFYGTEPPTAYIVMSLVGPDLLDLKHALPGNKFSMSTSLRIGQQCLAAIQNIHQVGFLHRDIKPSNFAMGCDNYNARTVFLLDFGMARAYINADGSLRARRDEAGFRGTTRYASLNTLRYRDMGRVDDLWSLFYVILECMLGRLPWRNVDSRRQNKALKMATGPKDLLRNAPKELQLFWYHLEQLGFYDKPDYAKLSGILQSIVTRKNISPWEPFDWEKPLCFQDPTVWSQLGELADTEPIIHTNLRTTSLQNTAAGSSRPQTQ